MPFLIEDYFYTNYIPCYLYNDNMFQNNQTSKSWYKYLLKYSSVHIKYIPCYVSNQFSFWKVKFSVEVDSEFMHVTQGFYYWYAKIFLTLSTRLANVHTFSHYLI